MCQQKLHMVTTADQLCDSPCNMQIAALQRSSVCVMYASAYGNTAALAQAVSRGVTKGGVGVNTINLELASLDEVVAAVKESDGFTIGSPTLGGHMPTPVQVGDMGASAVCGSLNPCTSWHEWQ